MNPRTLPRASLALALILAVAAPAHAGPGQDPGGPQTNPPESPTVDPCQNVECSDPCQFQDCSEPCSPDCDPPHPCPDPADEPPCENNQPPPPPPAKPVITGPHALRQRQTGTFCFSSPPEAVIVYIAHWGDETKSVTSNWISGLTAGTQSPCVDHFYLQPGEYCVQVHVEGVRLDFSGNSQRAWPLYGLSSDCHFVTVV